MLYYNYIYDVKREVGVALDEAVDDDANNLESVVENP